MGSGPGAPFLDNIADQEDAEVGPIVVAESEDLCEEALRLIKVDWEVKPHIVDPRDGIKPGRPRAHAPRAGERQRQHRGCPEDRWRHRGRLQAGGPNHRIRFCAARLCFAHSQSLRQHGLLVRRSDTAAKAMPLDRRRHPGSGPGCRPLQAPSRKGESSHPVPGRQVLRLGIPQEPVDYPAAGQAHRDAR